MYVDTSCFDAAGLPRMQRAEGRARIVFRARAGATRLERLFQEGCAKMRLPTALAGAAPEVILINTAGGLTGDDSLATEVTVAANASAIVTTQACERIYRSTGLPARVFNSLHVSVGAKLAWLPQETILFDCGRLKRTLEADIEGDGELVAVEAIIFGRTAMGEAVRSGALHDRWRIRRNSRLLFADDLRMDGRIADQMAHAAVLDGNVAMATVLYAGPDPERFLEPSRAIIGEAGGASAWEGKFLARLVAESGFMLRRRLEPLLTLLLPDQPLPKVWQL
jgi:urease accessory protein